MSLSLHTDRSRRSQVLNPGEPIEYAPPADLKITSAALGDELADSNARSSVRLIYSAPRPSEDDEDDDEDLKLEPAATVLCSLTPGKVNLDCCGAFCRYADNSFRSNKLL